MTTAAVTIGRGMYDTSVVINGHDIGTSVRSIVVHAKAGHLTTIELDLLVGTETRLDLVDALATVPPAVHDALVTLGWTPPAGATDGPHPTTGPPAADPGWGERDPG